ncbi:MAG: hypothetical protein EP343_19985 [Deltaproteobacteria bacterium]|nr:MAG: hypothetical protein EP343_19985 [Deltaproteobacteria bacterium]
MSSMKIRFRDPSSGQMMTVEGEVVNKIRQDNPQSVDELRNNPHDGSVDLFVHMDKNYGDGWGKTTKESVHLQINNEHLTEEQATALAAAIRSGDDQAVTLEGQHNFTVFSIQTDLWNERAGELGGAPHDPMVSLTGNEENGVFLSEEGVFSTAAGETPGNIQESAEALFRAAEASDQLAEGETIFSRGGVNLETKTQVFHQIESLLNDTAVADLSPNEAAQLRSSASTVLTDMISTLGHDGPEGELQQQAFDALHGMIQNETVGGLKESMIFNAVRVQSTLNDASFDIVDDLRAEIAPTHPPTDKWFADGKRELNISFAAGHGEGFYEGVTEYLGKEGYEVVEDGNRSSWNGSPRKLQMKKMVNGEEYTVNIDLRDFNNDSFKDIDNDNYDIVVYQGHSNLGNNTRKSVENAPDATGKDKLVFLGLCAGKDNLDRVRKAFPEAQLVTTFNSSYFNTKSMPDGDRQFTQGEDVRALMEMVNGSLERQSWSEINDNIRDEAVGWNHKDATFGNYITPLDLQAGAKFRDLDNDGVAMGIDRHFNVDVMEVDSAVSSTLEPRNNNAEGKKLNGELPHLAAAFGNTIDLYNPTYDNFSHKGRILSDGYFKGTEGDPIVRFDTRVENGEKSFVMQVNEDYAHIGEEALRAISMVEYNRHLASTEDSYPVQDPVERELVGMLTAAASLTYDAGWRDAAVFGAIRDHYDMPEGLKWSDAGYLIDKEKHDYTGSVSMARKWMEKMSPETIEALRTQFGG